MFDSVKSDAILLLYFFLVGFLCKVKEQLLSNLLGISL